MLDGAATVRFDIPHLHLHAGHFAITLAIADHDTVCHWLDRWIEFDVFQAGTGVGIVDMIGTWTIGPRGAVVGVARTGFGCVRLAGRVTR